MNSNTGKRKDSLALSRPLTVLDVWEGLSRNIWDSWRPFSFQDSLVAGPEIFEEKGNLVVKTKLPGVDKQNLDITLEGDTLTIKAEKKEKVVKDTTHEPSGCSYRRYLHSITLPYPVKEDEVIAKFDKGVLEMRLPKGEDVKPKKIEVKKSLPKGHSNKPK